MKKEIIKKILVGALASTMALGSVTGAYAEVTADQYDNDDGLMAHNIYSNPVLSQTSGKFNTYIIDFWGEQTPNVTYWALANFGMTLSAKTKITYKTIKGGGAYTGLQTRDKNSTKDGKVAILSFWEYFYIKDGKEESLRAYRMYPSGKQSEFGGEGEGTNWISFYPWKDQTWYRMALHCWEDEETGQTFVGQWVCDLSTGEWYLNAYFNTYLYDANINGGLGLFMENYVGGLGNWTNEREYRVKNMYVNDAKDGFWKSITSTKVSWSKDQKNYLGTKYNKMGAFDFGTGSDADGEYFWAVSGGRTPGQDPDKYDREAYVKAQREYEATKPSSQTFTISQADQPTLGTIALDKLEIVENKNGTYTAKWAYAKASNPQLSYKLQIVDGEGNELFSKYETRPEVTEVKLTDAKYGDVKCILTVKDIFGAETKIETNAKIGSLAAETTTPATTEPAPAETVTPEATPEATPETTPAPVEEKSPIAGIILGIVAAVAVIGGGITAVLFSKKKKK